MRVAVATVQVPFIRGGAEVLASGLVTALKQAGHEVELVTMPFRFSPPEAVRRSMEVWAGENFELLNGYDLDRVICLKFPTYYLHHPKKVVWLAHQHRAVYDLWDTPFGDGLAEDPEGVELRDEIVRRDKESLASCGSIYTISANVCTRLERFNRVDSRPLHPPPKLADRLYCEKAEPYIFAPSRLETLKRQNLLIKAMSHVTTPVVALLAGEGPRQAELQSMIEDCGLSRRVRLLGPVSDQELVAYYAHCLGVFFGPFDEDYGYVTLEAMLAAKPVITCTDSGGPLEFIVDRHTGFVVEPQPESIARAIDELYQERRKAEELGENARERYHDLNISWGNVVRALLASPAELDPASPSINAPRDTTQRVVRSAVDSSSEQIVRDVVRLAESCNMSFRNHEVSIDAYKKYVRDAGYQLEYPDYYPGNIGEKSFEHYVALTLLNVSRDEVFLDVASEHSPLSEIVTRLIGASAYSQDIAYQPGLNGSRIGGDASSMPLPDGFVSKAALTCSLEHFERDGDTRLFRELARVLKPGGMVCVVPFYLFLEPAIQTDPAVCVGGGPDFDKGATIYRADGWGNRHGRFYSPQSFLERVVNPLGGKLQFEFFRLANATEIHPSVYARFAFTATRVK